MGDIFICHTLYHVLIALVRALRSRPGKSHPCAEHLCAGSRNPAR